MSILDEVYYEVHKRAHAKLVGKIILNKTRENNMRHEPKHPVTWKEFKEAIESRGVKDTDLLSGISWSSTLELRTITVYRWFYPDKPKQHFFSVT